jgi:hypothetical protein
VRTATGWKVMAKKNHQQPRIKGVRLWREWRVQSRRKDTPISIWETVKLKTRTYLRFHQGKVLTRNKKLAKKQQI